MNLIKINSQIIKMPRKIVLKFKKNEIKYYFCKTFLNK